MQTFSNTFNGESGSSVRGKLNNVLTSIISGKEGINAIWAKIESVTQRVNAMDSGISHIVKDTSYNPSSLDPYKNAVLVALCTGTFNNIKNKNGTPITIQGSNALTIFYRAANTTYWEYDTQEIFPAVDSYESNDYSKIGSAKTHVMTHSGNAIKPMTDFNSVFDANGKSLTDVIGKNALYAGIATPTTNPGVPDGPVFYVATEVGTYSNFGNFDILPNEIALFVYNSSWRKHVLSKPVGIASFSFEGSITKEGLNSKSSQAKRTNFIKIKEGVQIKAYDGGTDYPAFAAVAFYNANLEFISTMPFSTSGLKEIVLTSSNIPSDAEYFIASTLNRHLDVSYVKYISGLISTVSDNTTNMLLNGVVEDSLSLFTKHYFIYENKLYSNEEAYISTDFLYVDGISDVFFWQLSAQNDGRVVAFFDENKKFMSDYGANGLGLGRLFSGKVKVPAEAKWVMFIGAKEIATYNPKISFNSIRGMNLMISDLASKVGQNKSSISYITHGIDSLKHDVEAIQQNSVHYSNALNGVNFGTTEGDLLFKNALKKVWIQILDPSFNATTLKLVHLCNKSNEKYNPWLAFYDQDNKYAISWYGQDSVPRTGIQHLSINGFDKYIGQFCLHLVIDWDEIQEKKFTYGLQTIMDVSELNKEDLETRTTVEQLTYASNDWKDNTIVCFGDSITEFTDSTNMGYADYLKQFTGANVIKLGIGGTQFRQRTIPVSSPSSNNDAYASLDIINMVKACCEQDFTNQIAANDWLKDRGDDNTAIINRMIAIDWSKVNAVTFFAGTNDWNNASDSWGKSGSTDVNTTLGAVNEIIRLILTSYPHVRIYWFTPIVRWLDERIQENFSDNLVRGTKTLKEFSAMIQAEVTRHHIPVCDMYNTLGWNMYNFSNYFTDTDGTHPRKGYAAIARKIKGFIDANRTF